MNVWELAEEGRTAPASPLDDTRAIFYQPKLGGRVTRVNVTL